ncbi:hypothetical protein [Mycobacterium sp. 1274761.0]|uniref:hypothetical protein n=1 Tax=Mycobacterium sp. 1274761.0 TaxID=1834077 RepID=UPI0007FBC96D|nr:hypothetical protein [Mycobacterium sp. 1274761.0]OBK74631.1 hypothetical protein A5651_09135 [Mycobacterium sp. 1274761.0]
MTRFRQRIAHVIVGVAAAAAFLIVTPVFSQAVPQASAQPCVNGVIPWNPYVVNCNLPPRGPRVRGAAPDAGAIIACHDHPGCLSWYVNGPW